MYLRRAGEMITSSPGYDWDLANLDSATIHHGYPKRGLQGVWPGRSSRARRDAPHHARARHGLQDDFTWTAHSSVAVHHDSAGSTTRSSMRILPDQPILGRRVEARLSASPLTPDTKAEIHVSGAIDS